MRRFENERGEGYERRAYLLRENVADTVLALVLLLDMHGKLRNLFLWKIAVLFCLLMKLSVAGNC